VLWRDQFETNRSARTLTGAHRREMGNCEKPCKHAGLLLFENRDGDSKSAALWGLQEHILESGL
jgi:hypothetical protein